MVPSQPEEYIHRNTEYHRPVLGVQFIKTGRMRAAAALILILFLQACATTPSERFRGISISPPVPDKADDLAYENPGLSIGVPNTRAFSASFDFYFVEKKKRSSSGASEGASGGLQASIGLAGATGGVGIVAAPVLVPLGMLIGGLVDSGSPVNEKTVSELRSIAQEDLEHESVQEKLVRKVVEYGRSKVPVQFEPFDLNCVHGDNCDNDFRGNADYDAILEMQVIRTGFAETGNDSRAIQLIIDGWAKLIRTKDKKVLRYRPFAVRTSPQKMGYFLDRKNKTLEKTLDAWLEGLASNIVQDMVLLPDTVPVYGDAFCWLKPLEPEMEPFPAIMKTTTPILRWTPFSKEDDKTLSGSDASVEISEVTYDVIVWDVEWDQKEHSMQWKAKYLRFGLQETESVVSPALEMNRTYYWSVRAHFLENGIPRRTGWSQKISKSGKMPKGWRLTTPDQEPAWPPEWDLPKEKRKSISQDLMNRLQCISAPEYNRFFGVPLGLSYEFRILE